MSATIYKISDRETGMCYIGCTSKPLDVRVYQHQTSRKAACTAQLIIQRGVYDVEILERCPFEERFERERQHIAECGDRAVNRVGHRREEITTARVGSRPERNQRTGIRAESRDEYGRLYREQRAENIKEYNTEYYERNRARLTAKQICAVCGGTYCQLTKSNHVKTKKHMRAEVEVMEAELQAMVQDI